MKNILVLAFVFFVTFNDVNNRQIINRWLARNLYSDATIENCPPPIPMPGDYYKVKAYKDCGWQEMYVRFCDGVEVLKKD